MNRCPQCGSNDPAYPMLISFNEPRTLCANKFHEEFMDMMRPTLFKVIAYWWRIKGRRESV